MSIRRIVTVVLTAMLLVCLSVSTAMACACGGHHKTYLKDETKIEQSTKLVTNAQTWLKTLGYNFTKTNGKVNSSMRAALKRFQYDSALKQDGKLNNCTLYRLESRANAVKSNRSNKSWKNLFNGDYRLLQLKNSNSRVRALNKALCELGFGTGSMKRKNGTYSDTFTADTYQAVVKFQKKYVKNRESDGKAGPYTLSTLERIWGAKKK